MASTTYYYSKSAVNWISQSAFVGSLLKSITDSNITANNVIITIHWARTIGAKQWGQQVMCNRLDSGSRRRWWSCRPTLNLWNCSLVSSKATVLAAKESMTSSAKLGLLTQSNQNFCKRVKIDCPLIGWPNRILTDTHTLKLNETVVCAASNQTNRRLPSLHFNYTATLREVFMSLWRKGRKGAHNKRATPINCKVHTVLWQSSVPPAAFTHSEVRVQIYLLDKGANERGNEISREWLLLLYQSCPRIIRKLRQ